MPSVRCLERQLLCKPLSTKEKATRTYSHLPKGRYRLLVIGCCLFDKFGDIFTGYATKYYGIGYRITR